MTAADIERLTKLLILGQQAFAEAMTLLNQHKQQQGQSTEEILAHAEKTNDEAKALIDSL